MGKGKGGIDSYKSLLNKNDLLFELRGVSFLEGIMILSRLYYKMPVHVGLKDQNGHVGVPMTKYLY